MNVDLLTFACVARARGSSQLKRPSCLKFQTKGNIKKMEVRELLKSINYPVTKLVGIADMKSRSIDITCKTIQYVVELKQKLRNV